MAADGEGRKGGFARLQHRLLQPPRLTATADLPLDATAIESDNFDLGYRLGPVYDILRHPRTETPLAVAVYGDWGSGKTSAMKWLEARLEGWNDHVASGGTGGGDAVRLVPVWFYPWKYQQREDVWRGLIAEVILATLARNEAEQEARKQAESLEFLGRGLRRLISGVKLQLGAGSNKVTLDLKDVLKDDATEARPEADYLNEFESALEGWLDSNLNGDERLVVFIDDLDRCLPQVALQVLEALKLYLNLPKLAFVAGVDRTVINQLVQRHYHELGLDEEKSGDYLGKMFQIEVTVAPSEREAGDYLAGVLDGNQSWATLEQEHRDIFRGVILNLVRRSPREIKRVVNSALIAGEGIEMSSRDWTEGAPPPTLAHGIQNELIRRILRDRHRRETLLGSETGNAFFGQWSDIVRADPDSGRTLVIPDSDLSLLRGERHETTVGTESSTSILAESDQDALAKIPKQWRTLVEPVQFRPLLELLVDEDLGNLMRVPFSAEAAEIQHEDVFADARRIVDEAVARRLKKPVDELTDNNREHVTELKIDSSDFADARPLAALTGLQVLSLARTQVSDLGPLTALTGLRELFLRETPVSDLGPLAALTALQRLYLEASQVSDLGPLAALTGLQVLDLTGTPVSDEQVAALQATLPNLEIRR